MDIDALLGVGGGGGGVPSNAPSRPSTASRPRPMPAQRNHQQRPVARTSGFSKRVYQDDDNQPEGQMDEGQYDESNYDQSQGDNTYGNGTNERVKESDDKRNVAFTDLPMQQEAVATSAEQPEPAVCAPKISLSKSTRKFKMTNTTLEQAIADDSNGNGHNGDTYMKPMLGVSVDAMAGLSQINSSSGDSYYPSYLIPYTLYLPHTISHALIPLSYYPSCLIPLSYYPSYLSLIPIPHTYPAYLSLIPIPHTYPSYLSLIPQALKSQAQRSTPSYGCSAPRSQLMC